MRGFLRDNRGVVAVEAAMILPVVALLMFGATDAFLCYSAQSASTAAATACATVGGRLLDKTDGAISRAKSAARTTFDANKPTFGLTGTMAIAATDALDSGGAVTLSDGKAVSLRCSVTNSTTIPLPLFNIFTSPFASAAQVQS